MSAPSFPAVLKIDSFRNPEPTAVAGPSVPLVLARFPRVAGAAATRPDPVGRALLQVSLAREEARRRTGSLPEGSDSQDMRDLRRFPRRPGQAMVSVCRYSVVSRLTPRQVDWALEQSEVCGRLLDLSQNGVSVLLPQNFPVGHELLMRLWHSPQRPVDATGKVVRSETFGHGFWIVSCELIGNLRPVEVDQLSQPEPACHHPGIPV